jgi:hypothetical protein
MKSGVIAMKFSMRSDRNEIWSDRNEMWVHGAFGRCYVPQGVIAIANWSDRNELMHQRVIRHPYNTI